jgi:hypothetical protein
MGPGLVPVAGPTRAPLAAPLLAGRHRAEAGSGEGDEQPRMAGDAGGDALAALQAGPDQLEASARSTAAQDGQRDSRRSPQAVNSTASGSSALS